MAQVASACRRGVLGAAARRVLVAAGVASCALLREADARPPLSGHREPALYVALHSGRMPDGPLLSHLTPETRRQFETRVRLRANYRPRLTRPWPVSPEVATTDDPYPGLEAYLVAASGHAATAGQAAAYARGALLFNEYEGYSQGPLDEAAHAYAFLSAHPGTAIGPGLDLFLLGRYRAAFEAADYEGDDDAKAFARGRYREIWVRTRRTLDAVNLAVADDIDSAERVYIRCEEHPRQPSP